MNMVLICSIYLAAIQARKHFPIENKTKISNNMIPYEKRKERGTCSYLIHHTFFKWTPIFFSIIENKNHGHFQQNCKLGTLVISSEFPIKRFITV